MYFNHSRCHKLTSICTNKKNDENLPVNFQKEGSKTKSVAVEENIVPAEDDDEDITKISYCSSNTADTFLMNEYGPVVGSTVAFRGGPRDDSIQSSDFGDAECGEPFEPQRLTFDFTPSEDDTEFVRQKCFDFWSFISSMPHMKDLMVIPEPDEETESLKESVSAQSPSPVPVSIPKDTAVEFVKKYEGTLTHALCTKQPTLCRDKEYRSYRHGSTNRLAQESTAKLKLNAENASKEKSLFKKLLPSIETPPSKKSSPGFLKNMCSELEAWDQRHPKSYDPPTLPPPLSPEPSEPSLPSFESVPKELLCSSGLTCMPCSGQP